jgi:hypothetical protein
LGSKRKITWEKAVEEAFRVLKPQLDFLREHDLKAKASRPSSP